MSIGFGLKNKKIRQIEQYPVLSGYISYLPEAYRSYADSDPLADFNCHAASMMVLCQIRRFMRDRVFFLLIFISDQFNGNFCVVVHRYLQ